MRRDRGFFMLLGLFLGVILGWAAYDFGVSGSCPVRNCVGEADVEPVFNREYAGHALRIIDEARDSVHIVAFQFKYYHTYPDSLQNRIVRRLIYAHERGVDVRIVVDEYSTENNAYDILLAAGIPVRFDGGGVTTHAKLIIVDGEVVLLGSTNFSHYGLEKNNEANVLLRDRGSARAYESFFEDIWARGHDM
jgi:phosphatidylserine/phosphatidylglycerophosphate/cardiolipin synthase-like enzyme